jgi:hypothetical protein
MEPRCVCDDRSHRTGAPRGIRPARSPVRTSPLDRRKQRVPAAPLFRVFTHLDVPGIKLGGVIKNVVAIAAGMADGLSVGDNIRAGIITVASLRSCVSASRWDATGAHSRGSPGSRPHRDLHEP